ncbi:hypothetical protein F183_A27560 [Bryobacterales bacterium F-183]|nr:hypothetical protein F183_A27560 [Bryobacterales bacterium F-183]
MLLDALDELETDNFFIGVHVLRQSATSGSGKRLKRFVIEQFGKLHRDEIRSRFEQVGLDGLPTATYQEEGWEILLTALPKSDSSDEDEYSRAIGFEQTGVIELKTSGIVRRALEKKAARYGHQGCPQIIAVNSLDPFTSDQHFSDALFGDECFEMTTTETGHSFRETRLPNGLWHDGSGPRYRRISGVLAFTNATTSRGFNATATLYLNPWASEPYQGELTRLTTARVHAGRLVTTPGTPLTEVLGLPG